MNIKKVLYFVGTSMLSLLAASCSGDDMQVAGDNTALSGEGVKVSVTARIGDEPLSRAEIKEHNGSIKSYWNAGDVIYGYDQRDGSYVGCLTAEAPNADGYSEFSGTLYVYEHTTLNFYYLGDEPDRSFNEFVVDLQTQNASLEEMGKFSYLCTTGVTFDIERGYGILNKDTGKSLSFDFFLSYVHFDLQFPTSAGYTNEDIVISGTNLKNVAYLVLGNNQLDLEEEDGSITVNRVNDIYLAIIPNQDIEFNFYAQVNGEEYIASYGIPKTMLPSVYYRRQLANGSFVGVPIVFTMVEPDLSNNPLYKWAESNLTGDYDGGDPYNNVFADNATDGGYYYQWGRNHGFKDADDAVGVMNEQKVYYEAKGIYYFCREYGYSYPAGSSIFAHSGMPNSMHWTYVPAVGTQRLFEESPVEYTTPDELRMWPEWYMMANYGLYGTYNYDYWTFSGGGSNWYERADLCGYARTNPCPEGWRLPTTAEFEEIMPTVTIDAGRKAMTSVLNNRVEVRRSLKGEKYAIRWIAKASAPAHIKIQAVVVPESFDESQVSAINWEGRDVVTRIFPYGGMIEGVYYKAGYSYDPDYVARPMPRGTINSRLVTDRQTYYQHYELSIAVNLNAAYGSYWAGDAVNSMRMQDYGIISNSNVTTYFEMGQGSAQDARAIRCVMDENPDADYTGHYAAQAAILKVARMGNTAAHRGIEMTASKAK